MESQGNGNRRNGNNNSSSNNNQREGRRSKGRFEGPKREAILKLEKYLDQPVIVTLSGGREVEGKLTGYDQLMNLVLDDTVETLRDTNDRSKLTGETRTLGRVVIRGPLLLAVSPKEGFESIPNPFIQPPQQPQGKPLASDETVI